MAKKDQRDQFMVNWANRIIAAVKVETLDSWKVAVLMHEAAAACIEHRKGLTAESVELELAELSLEVRKTFYDNCQTIAALTEWKLTHVFTKPVSRLAPIRYVVNTNRAGEEAKIKLIEEIDAHDRSTGSKPRSMSDVRFLTKKRPNWKGSRQQRKPLRSPAADFETVAGLASELQDIVNRCTKLPADVQIALNNLIVKLRRRNQ